MNSSDRHARLWFVLAIFNLELTLHAGNGIVTVVNGIAAVVFLILCWVMHFDSFNRKGDAR